MSLARSLARSLFVGHFGLEQSIRIKLSQLFGYQNKETICANEWLLVAIKFQFELKFE